MMTICVAATQNQLQAAVFWLLWETWAFCAEFCHEDLKSNELLIMSCNLKSWTQLDSKKKTEYMKYIFLLYIEIIILYTDQPASLPPQLVNKHICTSQLHIFLQNLFLQQAYFVLQLKYYTMHQLLHYWIHDNVSSILLLQDEGVNQNVSTPGLCKRSFAL